jgi:hypothetical protein
VAKMLHKKLGHDKKLLRTSFGTSTQELALAKPLCRGMKFASKPCGLSVAEKASIAGVVVGGKKVKRAVSYLGHTRHLKMIVALPSPPASVPKSPLLRS